MSARKTLENLTRNQYVGLGLAGLVVAVGAYFLVKKILSDVGNLGSDVGKAVGHTADQLGGLVSANADPDGSTFTKWYDPTQRTVFFYWIPFPDGVHHIVGAGSVRSDGTFDYDGNSYRIGYDKIGNLRAYASAVSSDMGGPNFGVTGGW
jgi:hypothetical protein